MLAIVTPQIQAQPGQGGGMGGPPSGPSFGGEIVKLFGDHTAFTATIDFQFQESGSDEPTTIPGRVAFLEGKSRFEMDLANAKGPGIPANAAAQMKQMGMDRMIAISLPEKKLSYLVYPGLEAYVETPIQDPDALKAASEFDMEVTELGREEVSGQNCIKNKVIVTDKDGQKHESTVWNAIDLKDFPVRIEASEQGQDIVMRFKEVKLSKPSSSSFEPPADYPKYDNMMTMIQEVMMKRMGSGAGMPPGQ